MIQLGGNNSSLLKTKKDTAIENAVSLTGLPEAHIKLLYESDMLEPLMNKVQETNVDIELTGFVGNISKNEIEKKVDFSISKEISNILNSEVMLDTKLEEVKRLTDKAQGLFNIDSVDLLTGISNLLIITDPKAKEYILGLNKLHTPSDVKDVRLNESFQFDLEVEKNKKVELFESLKVLLTKQNRRWGNNYRMENTYRGIMEYLESETQQILLSNEIESVNTQFQLDIIKSILNNEDNPMYRDFSTIKHLVSDSQTFVFDLTILVHRFISDNKSALEYLSPRSVSEYISCASALISELSSSTLASRILQDEFKHNYKELYATNNFGMNNLVINDLSHQIDFEKLFHNRLVGSLNITGRSCQIMLDLIKSSSHQFNLRIRPILNQYITKALNLTQQVDKARFELNKFLD